MKMGQSIITLLFVSVVSAARAEGIVSIAGHAINTDSAPVCILSRSSDNKPYPSKRYICEQILGVGDLRVKTLHADWCEKHMTQSEKIMNECKRDYRETLAYRDVITEVAACGEQELITSC